VEVVDDDDMGLMLDKLIRCRFDLNRRGVSGRLL